MENSNSWTEYKALGNVAESIVEFLINSAPDWKCVKYGMENHIEDIRKLLKDNNKDETSRRIRSMPDFIAVNKKTNEVMLIDVKFRSFIDKREQGVALYGLGYGQMKDYLEFWGAIKLIIIHPHEPYFFVIDLKDVEWHKHFHSRTKDDKGRLFEQWNFYGISKTIRDIFPTLSEASIKKAISLIPNKQ